jgi:hypothetical protein
LTERRTRTVTIWVRPHESDALLRHVIAHEIGHALDLGSMTSTDRQRYLSLRGRSGSSWFPASSRTTSDFASAAEDFAEVFALWRLGNRDFRSRFAPRPTAGQLRALDPLFQDLEGRMRS